MILSIVTVVKNDITRLIKTIESLKYYYNDKNFEHIIVDGKSTDNTSNTIKKIKQYNKNILFKSSQDNGIYDAMNIGIGLSNGDFILFLNAGDKLIADKFELLKKINKYIVLEPHILCFPFSQVFREQIIERFPKKKCLDKLPTSHQAMVFSKKFLQVSKYNLSYKIASDFDLYSQSDKSKVYFVSNFTVLTMVEGEGVASQNFLLSYLEYLKIISNRYSGLLRLVLLLKVICKIFIMTIFKLLLTKLFFVKLKKVLYQLLEKKYNF
jgi:putative colanic acid biosynthesis glycosyltransferase